MKRDDIKKQIPDITQDRSTGTWLNISIHAPRVGCDVKSGFPALLIKHFNPRTPRGVRPGGLVGIGAGDGWHFNPRTPRGVRQ